jgi:hypothetical protein
MFFLLLVVSGDSSYYLAGIFYEAAAEINFKDSDKKYIKKDYEIVTRGFHSYIHTAENNNRKYVCIGFPRAFLTASPNWYRPLAKTVEVIPRNTINGCSKAFLALYFNIEKVLIF